MKTNRFIIMSLVSIILGLFGCKSKKDVVFSEFNSKDDVKVVFNDDELEIGKLLIVQSTAKLRSKTTTIFTSQAFYSTNLTLDERLVVVGFEKVKSIPRNIKTKADRKPYKELNEKELKNGVQKIKSINSYRFEEVLKTEKLDLDTYVVFVSKLDYS